MDYFQGVVTEYLRANRATFVNTECLIQLDECEVPLKGRHWYCDAVAANFAEECAYLCEVSYSVTLSALAKRLTSWANNWQAVCSAIYRDCRIPSGWKIAPWVFIPNKCKSTFTEQVSRFAAKAAANSMPLPRVEFLEEIVPWEYNTWNRKLVELAEEAERIEP